MSKTKKNLQYYYTPEELKEFAVEMAQLNSRLTRLEDQKKQATAQYSAEIQNAKTNVNALAEKYNSGFEYRMLECSVKYDENNGMKTVYRCDNGELVGEYRMTDEDWEKLPGLREGEKLEPKPETQQSKDDNVEVAEYTLLNAPVDVELQSA